MVKVELSSNFIKKARKLSKKERIRLSKKVEIFKRDPFSPKLKTHPLKGKLKGLYSFSLSYSKRVLLSFVEKNKVLLLDVGTHEGVYK